MIQDKTMMFVRKHSNINEVIETLRESMLTRRPESYIIDHSITMERALFDSLLCDLFQPFNYFKNKGGYSDKGRHVIKITDKDTGLKLFVDPSGYNYARYVGIRVKDIKSFRARYKSINKSELKSIENSTSIEHFTSLRAFDLKHNR
tara:strand:- start:512 stop:952 length:441 start_codon:yes stop_codon:yes gene_type:complete